MKNDVMLIVNPVSGKGQYSTALHHVLRELAADGHAATVYFTTKSGDANEYARQFAPEYDLLICLGGDGTVSDAIDGLMRADNPPPMGYVPIGTANDMASNFKLDRNPGKAVRSILDGREHLIDVGRFNDRHFAYIAAFGAFTDVAYSTPQSNKNMLGHLAYVLEGLADLPKISSIHTVVEHDGGREEGDYVFGAVMNSLSVAGLVKLDRADVGLDDGFFEAILIKEPQNIVDMNTIIMGILRQNYDSEHIRFIHTKKIKFSFDCPVSWTIDGENGGSWEQVEAENLHRAVRLRVPEGISADGE
ncbi:MAG: YegS/Rv2252/BmrU family lipid kinase [Oscillospiraceae bacterium]|nr:YegS/Rv2252/BmrU family lipid kinase [Oscillospiraceae bacterium]